MRERTAAEATGSAYKQAFAAAAATCRRLGHNVEAVKWTGTAEIGSATVLVSAALARVGLSDASGSAGQCLKWSHFLAPYLGIEFGCRAWVTVGELWKDEVRVFDPTLDDISRWSLDGINLRDFRSGAGLNLHAWVTLATGHIVEPTLPSTLASCVPGYAHLDGGIMVGQADAMIPHRYVPLAVSASYVEELARQSAVPLLASKPGELMTVSAVLVHNDTGV